MYSEAGGIWAQAYTECYRVWLTLHSVYTKYFGSDILIEVSQVGYVAYSAKKNDVGSRYDRSANTTVAT